MTEETWSDYDGGRTLGTVGSEKGTIVLDQEHPEGLRITLERDGLTAPWVITCAVYGEFVHTAFAETEEQARSMIESMKHELVGIARESDEDRRFDLMKRFADRF